MDDNYRRYVDFLKYCNNADLYSTDFSIALCILENLNKLNDLLITDIALQSNTGVGSVNRFVKKAGFM